MARVRGVIPCLLLSALLVPVGGFLAEPSQAQEAPAAARTLLIEDPVGDVGPFGIGVAGNPAMTAYQHIDITRLEVGGDDRNTVRIALTVAGFDQTTTAPAQAAALQDFACRIRWTYDHGLPDVDYSYEFTLRAALTRIPGSPVDHIDPSFYWTYQDDDGRRSYIYSGRGAETGFDPDTSTFVALVQKDFVPVWPGGANAAKGDTLILQSASCSTDVLLYGQMGDQLVVEEGHRYAMQDPGPGRVVEVRFGDTAEETPAEPGAWDPPSGAALLPVSSVTTGVATVVPVTLTNHADVKKLVLLETAFTAGASGWNVTLAPSVFLSAGQSRTLRLIITPPADAIPGSEHAIEVTARTAGETHVGVAPRILRVVPVLDETHNRFYVHMHPTERVSEVDEVYGTAVPTYDIAASLLQDLTGYDNAPAEVAPATYWGGGNLLDPLVRPVRLDPEVPVHVAFALQGDAARQVQVTMWLTSEETGSLFEFSMVVPGDGKTELDLYIPAEEAVTLPAGLRLSYYLRVGPATIGPENAGASAFLASETSFTLPIMSDDETTVVTDGRFLPTLTLAAGTDRTAYINPGKEYAFDLILANEGIATDDLSIQINATNATAWQVEAMPGTSFRVTPGNSTPVSIVIRAPADVAEGAHPRFEVTALSKHDKAVRTSIMLDAIATHVDVEAKPYAAKADQLAPLEESKESPAAVWAAVVIALAALGQIRRRID